MTELDNEELSGLIGDIYDCALDPALWRPLLERIARLLGAEVGVIYSRDSATQRVTFEYDWGQDPHWAAVYMDKYVKIDPLQTACWHAEVDEPTAIERFMDPRDYRRTRFYREYCAPQHWCDMVGVIVEKSGSRCVGLTACRTEEAGMSGDRELKVMGLIAPHVRRAATIHGIIDRNASHAASLTATLDLLPIPVLLFDSSVSCIETNAAADRFLAHTDAMRIDAGRLIVKGCEIRRQITQAVEACAKGNAAVAACGVSLAMSTTDGARHVGHILPLTGGTGQRAGASRRAVAALFLQEVGNLRPLPGELLVKLYGLTPAETRLIALLAQGLSLEEAAETLGTAYSTVRTHLQNIFSKTNTNRQADVIRMVLSAFPAPARAEESMKAR